MPWVSSSLMNRTCRDGKIAINTTGSITFDIFPGESDLWSTPRSYLLPRKVGDSMAVHKLPPSLGNLTTYVPLEILTYHLIFRVLRVVRSGAFVAWVFSLELKEWHVAIGAATCLCCWFEILISIKSFRVIKIQQHFTTEQLTAPSKANLAADNYLKLLRL